MNFQKNKAKCPLHNCGPAQEEKFGLPLSYFSVISSQGHQYLRGFSDGKSVMQHTGWSCCLAASVAPWAWGTVVLPEHPGPFGSSSLLERQSCQNTLNWFQLFLLDGFSVVLPGIGDPLIEWKVLAQIQNTNDKINKTHFCQPVPDSSLWALCSQEPPPASFSSLTQILEEHFYHASLSFIFPGDKVFFSRYSLTKEMKGE